MIAVLIYPYPDDLEVVRVVLVRNEAERRRLYWALHEFDEADAAYVEGRGPEHNGVETWLKERRFEVPCTERLALPLVGVGP